jgi:hypothetical protein
MGEVLKRLGEERGKISSETETALLEAKKMLAPAL